MCGRRVVFIQYKYGPFGFLINAILYEMGNLYPLTIEYPENFIGMAMNTMRESKRFTEALLNGREIRVRSILILFKVLLPKFISVK
jgi:hypothetical protein